jgi:surfeit locus 1 family protein
MTSRQWLRPSWFAVALTVVGIALFVRLGVWQLDRADQAQALLDAFSRAPLADYEDFAAVRLAPPVTRYPHVRVSGHFLADRGYLRDEQVRDGQLGVEAYAVFVTDHATTQALLVDRGWIAWSRQSGTQQTLPSLPGGDVVLSGVYAPFPGNGIRVGGNALQAQAVSPKLTLAIDPEEIAADLKQPLLPRVLMLDTDAASGFARHWTPNLMSPQRHQAYAFQWFAFALAALAIFVLLHFRKVKK